MFLNATNRRITGASSSHPEVVREMSADLFFESCEFSNSTLERSEPGSTQQLIQYKGNRFVFIAINYNLIIIKLFI